MAASNCGNGPSAAWQLKAVEEQERIRLNLLNLRHRGKWGFVNELQPLAPRRLATMVHENDVGGLLDFFMPAPGPSKDSNRSIPWNSFRRSSRSSSRPTSWTGVNR
jgi:arachidonate 15-lipoxygenase